MTLQEAIIAHRASELAFARTHGLRPGVVRRVGRKHVVIITAEDVVPTLRVYTNKALVRASRKWLGRACT